jgi:hypothetical protein
MTDRQAPNADIVDCFKRVLFFRFKTGFEPEEKSFANGIKYLGCFKSCFTEWI